MTARRAVSPPFLFGDSILGSHRYVEKETARRSFLQVELPTPTLNHLRDAARGPSRDRQHRKPLGRSDRRTIIDALLAFDASAVRDEVRPSV